MAVQIDILLATCNSATYLSEVIDSILHQDYTDWRLLISDAGSTDGTVEIVQKYTHQHPQKIAVVNSEKLFSPCENFSNLLNASSSEYVMFCDHDDVWLPEKISKTLSVMKQAEHKEKPDIPILVFTDQQVVDNQCSRLSESSLKFQNLNPERVHLNHLLLQNVPSGCTMMLNRVLVDLCRPIPPQAVMHDHWVSLVAAAFGKIVFLDEKTMLYRQHGSNYFGAPKYGWRHFYTRYQQGSDSIRSQLKQYIDQAQAFYARYSDRLRPRHRQMLAELSRWSELSWWGRRKVLLKYRIFKTGFRRNLGMFLII